MRIAASYIKESMTEAGERVWDNEMEDAHWSIIEEYFKGAHLQQLVRHQIESYNDFVNCQIPKTIEMFNPVKACSEQDYDKASGKYKLEVSVTFENFSVNRPQIHENNGATKLMFPAEARRRSFTYAANMNVDMNIKYVVRSGANLESTQVMYTKLPQIHIGKLPIMLRSSICVLNQYKHIPAAETGECVMDAGGYFIIHGSEKTCLAQERAAENQVSCHDVSKGNNKWSWLAEIKSVPDWKCISPKQINMTIASKNNGFGFAIFVQIPRMRQPIPLYVLFRGLGIISDKEITELIVPNVEHKDNKVLVESLEASAHDASTYLTQEDALVYITTHVMYTPINLDKETGQKKKRAFAIEVLENDLFPHCKEKIQKIHFIGYMANKLLRCSCGRQVADDRDSYLNKRIDLTGVLLNNLFRNYFNKMIKDMQKQLVREINTGSWKSTDDIQGIINATNVYKIVKAATIENGLKKALATGDFAVKHAAVMQEE
jgi:DNA-directed RNA polymerase II subunit RPB2